MKLTLRGRSLFSRVFLHGLLVLIVTAATVVVHGALLVRPALDRHLLDFARWAAPHICKQRHAGEVVFPPRSIAALYDARGTLLASSVAPPLPPLAPALVQRLRAEHGITLSGSRALHAVWCGGDDGTYVQMGPPPPPLAALLVPIAISVLVVGLASIPFARSIAKPLAKLVRVTKAFGRGDLDVRIALTRDDEVGALAQAFNGMASRLQSVILAEQELLANVSHELRTPLARMRVVLETAEENPPRAAAMLHEIGRDLHDLERLVDSVTETMRLGMATTAQTSHPLPARCASLDLVGCLRAAKERFQALHPEREVRLEVPEAHLAVDADPRLIQRLLGNLLDNARKYSASASPIVLRAARVGERVAMEVSDAGIGIAPTDLPQVLEPFFRGERSRSTAPGSGLGLALVKRIVDVHEGEIVIDSQVGVGTTVRIGLRAASDPHIA